MYVVGVQKELMETVLDTIQIENQIYKNAQNLLERLQLVLQRELWFCLHEHKIIQFLGGKVYEVDARVPSLLFILFIYFASFEGRGYLKTQRKLIFWPRV